MTSDEPAPQDKPQIAVALKYEASVDKAPVVVAKGTGEVAAQIIETAKAHNLTLAENPFLALALSQLKLDQPIPPELYRAVAEVMKFMLRFAQKPRPAAPQE